MRSCRKPLVSIRFIFFFSAGGVLVLGVGLTQIYTEEWVITLHCPSLVHFSKLGHVPLGRDRVSFRFVSAQVGGHLRQ